MPDDSPASERLPASAPPPVDTGTFAAVAGMKFAGSPAPSGGVSLFQFADASQLPPVSVAVHTRPDASYVFGVPAAVAAIFTTSAFQSLYVPLGTVMTEYVIAFASGSFGTVNFSRSRSISARNTRPVYVPGSMSNA